MQKRAVMSILLPLVMIVSGCESRVGESFGGEDRAAVRSLLDRWLEANRTDDPSELAALVTEDAVVMIPGMPALDGRQAFVGFLRQLQYRNIDVSATTPDVDGREDLAYVRGTFSQTLALGDQAEHVTNRGNYLFIARRQLDGGWLFSHVIWAPDAM